VLILGSVKSQFLTMHNPSLREEARNKPASIVSSVQQVSILDWLASTGRLIARETTGFEYREDVEDLQELIVGEDNTYEDDDEVEELAGDDDEELD
jgi:hypothetical protein